MYISHDLSTIETRVVTTRIGANDDEYQTVSKIAYVRTVGTEKSYLNHFEFTYPGPESGSGLSSGKFINIDDLRPYPTLLEARAVLTGEGVVRRQIAKRMDDGIVKALQKKHGSQWMSIVLRTGKEAAFTYPSVKR